MTRDRLFGRSDCRLLRLHEVALRYLRARDVVELGQAAHLVDVDPKVRARADQAVGIGGSEAVV